MYLARAANILRKGILVHQDNTSKKTQEVIRELLSKNLEESSDPKPVRFLEMVRHELHLTADTNNDSDEAMTVIQLLHSNTRKGEINP